MNLIAKPHVALVCSHTEWSHTDRDQAETMRIFTEELCQNKFKRYLMTSEQLQVVMFLQYYLIQIFGELVFMNLALIIVCTPPIFLLA